MWSSLITNLRDVAHFRVPRRGQLAGTLCPVVHHLKAGPFSGAGRRGLLQPVANKRKSCCLLCDWRPGTLYKQIVSEEIPVTKGVPGWLELVGLGLKPPGMHPWNSPKASFRACSTINPHQTSPLTMAQTNPKTNSDQPPPFYRQKGGGDDGDSPRKTGEHNTQQVVVFVRAAVGQVSCD